MDAGLCGHALLFDAQVALGVRFVKVLKGCGFKVSTAGGPCDGFISEVVRLLNAINDCLEKGGLGALSDFWYFLTHSKKWWLHPIILALLFVGIGGTAATPFCYTLF